MIDLDAVLGLFADAGAIIIDIYHSFDVTINNHIYSGLVALIAILVFYWLACWMWGDDDDDS